MCANIQYFDEQLCEWYQYDYSVAKYISRIEFNNIMLYMTSL